MSTYHGKNGSILVGANAIAEVTSFDVTETASTDDDTVQGDDWETHLVRTKAWSGSINFRYWPGDTNGQAVVLVGDSVSLDLRPTGDSDGLEKLTGTATITSRQVSSDMGSVVTGTAQFTGNGALTHGTISS